MSKKIKIMIVSAISLIIIGLLIVKIFASNDTSFFKVSKNEIAPGEIIEMNLDISNVEYEKFYFKLSSNIDMSKLVVNEDVTIEKNVDSACVYIDKNEKNFDVISFEYHVPEDIKIGECIEFVAQIIIESESESEYVDGSIADDSGTADSDRRSGAGGMRPCGHDQHMAGADGREV